MIAAVFALVLAQQAATVVWENPPPPEPIAAEQTPSAPADATSVLPEWARADPFAFERARCSPLVRGDRPMEVCQAETRALLAAALGGALPEALRPPGMSGDCQMMRAQGGGSAYALQCGPRSRPATASAALREQDCRPRVEGGAFTSQCRPVDDLGGKGLSLRLWGADD